jgi:multidrug efflux pump subunit AcrB
MEPDGTYSKDRRRITQPVTRVPSSAVPPRPEAGERSRDSSSGVILNRTAGWTLAFLCIGVLAGVAWTITSFFTREHQIEHMETQQREQQAKIEEMEELMQEMARRIVLLETELEDR